MNSYCVPFALSFISGKTPDDIAELIREERGDGRPVRGVLGMHYKPVLRHLGFKITATVHRPRMTVRKWAANRAKWADKSTWLVRVAGHIMVYRDGIIYDNQQKAGAAHDAHEYSNSHVSEAFQVGAV